MLEGGLDYQPLCSRKKTRESGGNRVTMRKNKFGHKSCAVTDAFNVTTVILLKLKVDQRGCPHKFYRLTYV